jgi:hypothetical protein
MFRNRSFRRKTIPWFRMTGWGTVYLMQSSEDPRLFKVGYTKRRTKDRRAELKGKVNGQLIIIYGLSMPHAYHAEQRTLRGLRLRWFGRGDPRGTEWFRLRKNETMDDIKSRIAKAASQVRREAKCKLSWAKDAEIKIFNARDERRKSA